MSKTSKDYSNEGYYEAMNDLMVFIKELKAKKTMPTDLVTKVTDFAMNKRRQENFAA